MLWSEWVAIIASIFTLLSVCLNVIQYRNRISERKALRSQAQAAYNFHYAIARACTRARMIEGNSVEERLHCVLYEVRAITGIADAARSQTIAYSREHLNFTPFYEHPAYPGKEQPDEVKMGKPPEEAMRNSHDIK
jgi:hypothetical protein